MVVVSIGDIEEDAPQVRELGHPRERTRADTERPSYVKLKKALTRTDVRIIIELTACSQLETKEQTCRPLHAASCERLPFAAPAAARSATRTAVYRCFGGTKSRRSTNTRNVGQALRVRNVERERVLTPSSFATDFCVVRLARRYSS